MSNVARLRRIALPLDLERGSEQPFVHALAIALHCGAGLHVVHVHPRGTTAPYDQRLPGVKQALVDWGLLASDATTADILGLGIRVELDDIVISDDSQVAHAAAIEVASLSPDLLVLGTHRRRGLAQLLHPSVAERIARINRVPALFLGHKDPGWIDPATGKGHLRRVVAPVGGDVDADTVVRLASRWLPDLGSGRFDLTLVHVGAEAPEPPPAAGFEGTVRAVAHNVGDIVAGVQAEVELEQADLILMCSHGHDSWLDDLAGSKTEQVVRWTTTPVLAVPV